MLGKLLQGRYQIVQVLSAGGFCKTYLAKDTLLVKEPTCVIKHLLPASNHTNSLTTQRQLFNSEAEALKKLSNYHQVPQLLDYFEENLEFYLVQEFIAGHPLSIELQGQRWSESQVVELLIEVLSILKFVHSHKLIHQDIKPSNLIRRYQDGRLVLIDFGSSVKQALTQVSTTQGQSSASALGIPATLAIGTPGYMPIEQRRGRPRPNSDIYALGIISIQALTGLNPAQLLEDSHTGELIWQQNVKVSAELAYVLNKMVRYDFKERYELVTQVLQELQPLLNKAEGAEGDPLSFTSPSSRSSCASPPLFSPPASSPACASPPLLPFHKKSALLIAIGTSVAAALALMVGSYYFLRSPSVRYAQSPSPTPEIQNYPVSIPSKNTVLGNIFLDKTLTGHSNSVWSVALSSDEQTLVSGSEDKTIKVWNLDTGKQIRTLSGHFDTVRAVTFSPNGQTVASGSGDKTIKIWNLQTGEQIHTLSGHSGPVWSVALSRDGQTLVSGSEDNTIKIWNLLTRKLRYTINAHSGRVFSVALSPNAQTLASGGLDQTIKIWNMQTGELIHMLEGHSDSVRSVVFSPDGQKLASSSWDKTIKIWNMQTGKQLSTLEGHTDRVVSVAFTSNGQTLVSTSVDKTIKIWSVQTGKLLRNLSGHSDWVLSVATSRSGRTLVSSSKDKNIKIWQ